MRTNPPIPSPCHPTASADGPAAAPCHRPGALTAPAWPGALPARPLAGLTGEDRANVHQMNVRLREAEARAYAEYLGAYLEGARRCRTADELRAYGKPAGPSAGAEFGASHAEDCDIDRPYQRQLSGLLETNEELADLILRLERRPVPLAVFFDAALTAKVEVGGRTWGGTLSARGGATPEVGGGGITLKPGRLDAKLDAGVAAVRAAFVGGRLESVEVSARALPGVRAFARQSRGAVEHGIAVGGKVGGRDGAPALHVEARASVGVNLLDADTVRWALSSKSFWNGEK